MVHMRIAEGVGSLLQLLGLVGTLIKTNPTPTPNPTTTATAN